MMVELLLHNRHPVYIHHGCSSLCLDGFPERLVAASVMKTPEP
jgi:hypothetical protein